ncbi:MAG: TlpA family protein disulfide reductase [Oscillospiraceae bacterium]|nr:TlpA family protein disulfide reductase [Oscillospiraceae bacterium]MDD7292099.1 TlpA disulfide reductase family protein [Clostridiaceae bacterium]MDY5990914.1 TlpA disulfide reductase family protein [Oscillospiraceae bacterium]
MKKMLALFCAFALVLSVFCACAKTDPDETVQGSTSQQSTAPEKSTDTDKNEALSTSEKDESKKDSTTQSTTSKKERAAFPSFDAEDIFGAKVSSKVFEENKLTVVNLFTTWCAPCVSELPELAKLDNELSDIGFIGIVLDINEGDGVSESALRAAKDLCNDSGAEYPYLIPDESLVAFCRNIYNVPTTYFVDSDGKIVGDPIAGSNTASEWKEIIEQKLAML